MSDVITSVRDTDHNEPPRPLFWLILDCGHWVKWSGEYLEEGTEFRCPACSAPRVKETPVHPTMTRRGIGKGAEMEWQPIATCPTKNNLELSTRRIIGGARSKFDSHQWTWGALRNHGDRHGYYMHGIGYNPTHWAEIPEPPKEA